MASPPDPAKCGTLSVWKIARPKAEQKSNCVLRSSLLTQNANLIQSFCWLEALPGSVEAFLRTGPALNSMNFQRDIVLGISVERVGPIH
jgi:hypothetical protein